MMYRQENVKFLVGGLGLIILLIYSVHYGIFKTNSNSITPTIQPAPVIRLHKEDIHEIALLVGHHLSLMRKETDDKKVKIVPKVDLQSLINLTEIIKGPLLQSDKRVINFIMDNGYLLKPSERDVPYNLTSPGKDPSMGQSAVVKKILGEMKGGFFIECGALDGEIRSNTLSLERDYGWSGLLVEGDPSNYKMVLEKKRKAWTAGCCLAIHPYPHEVFYQPKFNMGRIKVDNQQNIQSLDHWHGKNKIDSPGQIRVQCFPIFSLLSAINVTTVDYFSLDVEGDELEVLKTIPFDLIRIKVLSVEFIHGAGGANALRKFMKARDYRVVATVTHSNNLANDLIFVHKSVNTQQR